MLPDSAGTPLVLSERRRARWIVATLPILFAALYSLSIGDNAPNIARYNFVFDADPARVMHDALVGQNAATYERHALFHLLIGFPARILNATHVANAVAFVITAWCAMGVTAAFVLFLRMTRSAVMSAAFAILYGVSASIWLLSAIPETFAISAAFIVVLLLLDHGGIRWNYRARIATSSCVYACAVGLATPNIIYVTLAAMSNAFQRSGWRARFRAAALLAVGALVAFFGFGLLQSILIPDTPHGLLSAPARAVAHDGFLRSVPRVSWLLENLRYFLLDAIVARPVHVTLVSTTEGVQQMMQYHGITALYVIGVAGYLCVATAALYRSRLERAFTSSVTIACCIIAFNLVFHAFYRANGQPIIFTAHTVPAILVILVATLAQKRDTWRSVLITAGIVAITVNNAVFIRDVRHALEASCQAEVEQICLRWTDVHDNARYSGGIPAFLASADYPLQLGRAALRREDTGEALRQLERAVQLDPALPQLSKYLGYALLRSGRNAEALPWLERAATERNDAEVRVMIEQARAGLLPAR